MQSIFSVLFSIAIVSCGQAQGSTPAKQINITPPASEITTTFVQTPSPKSTPQKEKPAPIQKKKTTKQKVAVPNKPKTTTSTQPKSTTSKSNSEDQILAIEREVARLVNIERKKQGLKPLILDSKLSMVARKKSQDMRNKNYFDHQSPTYGSPFDMMNHFGVHFQTAGENIAAGQRTAGQVMNGWMNSQGHRENILNPSFTHIGVGYVSGGSYGSYWTQMFKG